MQIKRKTLVTTIIAVTLGIIVLVGLFLGGGITGGAVIKSITCYDDDDCNDHNPKTEDFCKNPNSEYSLCVNKPTRS